ncbi:Uu.00g019800.m01.CDS01 [Anthostomella pinea]|uniref:Uu.00g019800.m01.CDS01 n=1 Tax=Anthostomella pinea TaxID=933095 RepID=A0AAI8VZD6_9PEZI|nr:Uu.00g019800.m01.CDS01 [Anthostomella pinea]
MSYQYPPSHNGAEMDMSHHSYMSGYPTPTTSSLEVRPALQLHPAQQLPPPPTPLSALFPPLAYPALASARMPLAQRRESLSRASKLKRSVSTPNVRPQGMNDSDSLSLHGEKKRNKLGYHRTSIACGNCRKRKIRCQPRNGDIQNRCEQCIRLKKDCNFYPVDQQPPPAALPRPGVVRSSAVGGGKLASTSASESGHPADGQQHHQQPYHQLASMPSIHSMGPPPTKQEQYPVKQDSYHEEQHKTSSKSSGSRTFGYGQGMASWAPTVAETSSPSTAKGSSGGDMINSSWRNYPQRSPVTPGYSPYAAQPSSATWPAAAAPLGTPVPVPAAATSRPEDGWSAYHPAAAAPTRSLSYDGEQHASQQQYVATTSSRPSYDRRASMASSSDLYHHSPISTTKMEGGVAGGAAPSASYGAWQQQQQPYQGWYGDSSGQPVVSSGAEHPAQVYYGR